MLKRYVGPHDEVRVVVAGTELGFVKQGESIAVPDEVAASTEWPSELWQDGAPAKQDGAPARAKGKDDK